MGDVPAVLGGMPAFPSKINIVRPVMPDISEVADGVQGILRSGMVTKGEHLKRFEQAVREHLGVNNLPTISTVALWRASDSAVLVGDRRRYLEALLCPRFKVDSR